MRLWKATEEVQVDLNYIRDKEKREVDFVLSQKGRPFCLIECKTSGSSLSSSLIYFQKKLNVPPAIQVVHQSGTCKKFQTEGFTQWVISTDRWLSLLP
jgi:hypothetical protein